MKTFVAILTVISLFAFTSCKQEANVDTLMQNMMMQGSGMQMMKNDMMKDGNMMEGMMQNMMKDGKMMNQMMQMMHSDGMMSETCMESFKKMMSDREMNMDMKHNTSN